MVFGHRYRGRGDVLDGVPGRRCGHRPNADDRVRGHEAAAPGLHRGELQTRSVPVRAECGHNTDRARRNGQRDAHLGQRDDAVQRVHGASPGRRRSRDRHFYSLVRRC